jgi:hypothetical protein
MKEKNEVPSPVAIEISGTVQKIIPATEGSPELAQIFLSCPDGTFAAPLFSEIYVILEVNTRNS